MDILISAASEEEIAPLREIWFRKHKVEMLVTGIGMVSTAYWLTREFSEKSYHLAINTGLAGAFDRTLRIGEIVRVTEDIISELGAEDGDNFLSLKSMGLKGTDTLINMDEIRIKEIEDYRKVRSVTVNTVHGNEESIRKIVDRCHPHIETMEGAAFFYVCGQYNIPSIQLRAISNYVERRDKSKWQIPLALEKMKEAITVLAEKI
ncbi:MAG: futalosine hydrolase [Bacteroidia bacterium]|nr:futalosine hydrolase [Bacteroidia bacterium]